MTTTTVTTEAVAPGAFVDILLGVECSRRIVAIESDTPLLRKQTETHATVRALTELKRDFVMRVQVDGMHTQRHTYTHVVYAQRTRNYIAHAVM